MRILRVSYKNIIDGKETAGNHLARSTLGNMQSPVSCFFFLLRSKSSMQRSRNYVSSCLSQTHFHHQVFLADDLDGFGFVSQDAWIQHMTIRDNILFGQPFYQKKYADVIDCCALQEVPTVFVCH